MPLFTGVDVRLTGVDVQFTGVDVQGVPPNEWQPVGKELIVVYDLERGFMPNVYASSLNMGQRPSDEFQKHPSMCDSCRVLFLCGE
jgi:hypothetical protein